MSFPYELNFLEAGIPELQAYLLSNEIYWPLGLAAPAEGQPYPQMTLGWILLSLKRAEAWGHTGLYPAQTKKLETLRGQMQETRAHWLTAWRKKAGQEFSSRLKLWTNFINEYRGDKNNAAQYSYEVQRRAILQILSEEADDLPPTERDLLQTTDSFLRAVLRPGGFVWEPELAASFPQGLYWYLYGSLPLR